MKWMEPRPRRAAALLAALTLACLLPFLGKAVHIDDPLFIWTARHIQSHPLDFYGFQINWDGRQRPMATVMQNPPLTAYYLAAAGSVLGWSETALHFAFLLPAIALVMGTYFLGREFCAHPCAAAAAVVAAPCFLVCATSLMCDTMMVAFWVWAAFFWIEGLEGRSFARLGLAALLITACCLTKYFGLSLIALLLVYSVAQERRIGPWLLFLCGPVLVLAGYQWMTQHLYGKGLLATAASYATNQRVGGGLGSKTLSGLAFTGGCILLPLLAVPVAWGKRGAAAVLAGVAATAGLLIFKRYVGFFPLSEDGHVKWLFVLQMAVFVLGGVIVLLLAMADALTRRTPASLLLLLWAGGTFLFASEINWTVSGRNILPMVPPVALLLIRHLESRQTSGGPGPILFWVPLGVCLAIALMAARADWSLAGSARAAALDITKELAPQSKLIAFEGHWGFQYYMEQLGAKALDQGRPDLVPGEAVVVPLGNSYLFALPQEHIAAWHSYRFPAGNWLCLASTAAGAGFYSDGWGPLPFVLQRAPVEEYVAFRIK
jgi:hypothetical protein